MHCTNYLSGRLRSRDISGSRLGGLAAHLDAIFGRFRQRSLDPAQSPSLKDVMLTSLNIMQVRITQSRLAGEPADILIRPRLSGIVAMDFHRGAVASAEGERATDEVMPYLREMMA